MTRDELKAKFPNASESFLRRTADPEPAVLKSNAPAFDDESELHDEIDRHCRERGFLVVHSRMDMPSTIAVGHPDFTIFMPGAVTVFIECKARGRKTTVEQLAKIAHARKLGFVAEVVDNMQDALATMARAAENH